MEAISCHSHPESAFILPGILPVFGKIPALIPEINQGWCSDDLAKVWSNSLSICDLASSCYNLKHLVCISLGWLKQSNNSPVVVTQILMHQRNWWISLLWFTMLRLILEYWSWSKSSQRNAPYLNPEILILTNNHECKSLAKSMLWTSKTTATEHH